MNFTEKFPIEHFAFEQFFRRGKPVRDRLASAGSNRDIRNCTVSLQAAIKRNSN
jgi:hypothetical protein